MFRSGPEPIRIVISYARDPWWIRHWRWWVYPIGFAAWYLAFWPR